MLLVVWFKVSSISLRTWVATELHPTLIDGGIVATLIVCYLLRQSWPDVAFIAFLGAIFVRPPVAIRSSRKERDPTDGFTSTRKESLLWHSDPEQRWLIGTPSGNR